MIIKNMFSKEYRFVTMAFLAMVLFIILKATGII